MLDQHSGTWNGRFCNCRAVGHTEAFHFDGLSAFRPCGRDLAEFFNSTGWAFYGQVGDFRYFRDSPSTDRYRYQSNDGVDAWQQSEPWSVKRRRVHRHMAVTQLQFFGCYASSRSLRD